MIAPATTARAPRHRDPALSPYFISRIQAASLAGVGTTTFDKMGRDGLMPASITIPGIRRRVWERLAVEAACARLAGHALPPQSPAADEPNPWDRVQ